MHGRLKVKTTAEQDAEKQKERKIKQAKYIKAMNAVIKMRENKVFDDEALSISGQLVIVNPDALSLWNFRRTILTSFKKDTEEDMTRWEEYLLKDLKVTENCLLKNPKSYGAWHHRSWILLQAPNPPLEEELELCQYYLQADERNFHCWDHRRFVVTQSSRSLQKELEFTQDLIDKNFSNYSAWHYRSKLLPILHPPLNDQCPQPVEENIFIQELDKVVTAVFTDPSDQSPWFFLRWLLTNKDQTPKLIQVGTSFTGEGNYDLLLIFSQRVSHCRHINLSIDNCSVSVDQFEPYNDDRTIWKVSFGHKADDVVHVEVSHDTWFPKVSVSIMCSSTIASFQWISKKLPRQTSLSEAVKNTLNQVKENCLTLDQVEAGNKWVLLTLVDVMSMLDVRSYLSSILSYLAQLETIDPLRRNFYKDASSKVTMESKLMDFLENGAGDEFTLRSENLTCLTCSQYLSSAINIDLSHNRLKNDDLCRNFVACRHLILDENQLSSLTLPERVECASVVNCGLESLSQVGPNGPRLRSIHIKGNKLPADHLKSVFSQSIQIEM